MEFLNTLLQYGSILMMILRMTLIHLIVMTQQMLQILMHTLNLR